MYDDVRCLYHDNLPGKNEILLEGGAVIRVCDWCRNRILKRERFVCKYCNVPIKSSEDTSPVFPLTTPHKFTCPRAKWGEVE